MPTPANYFAHATAAERYARGRPYLHPAIVRRICDVTGAPRFGSVLDVGCGTGQSTRAIAEVADRVIGIDNSPEMLAQSSAGPGIEYQQSAAESLPFADRSFDLVTVGLAFHWLRQEEFLPEARRALRDDGWLVIYNSGFLGEVDGAPEFSRWYRDVYLSHYPIPARSQTAASQDFVRPFGFELVQTDTLMQEMSLSSEQCVSYLLTQSNIIVAVERGPERLEAVAEFLSNGVAPFFCGQPRMLRFQSDISFLYPRD